MGRLLMEVNINIVMHAGPTASERDRDRMTTEAHAIVQEAVNKLREVGWRGVQHPSTVEVRR
jgi:hypothetical protein